MGEGDPQRKKCYKVCSSSGLLLLSGQACGILADLPFGRFLLRHLSNYQLEQLGSSNYQMEQLGSTIGFPLPQTISLWH